MRMQTVLETQVPTKARPRPQATAGAINFSVDAFWARLRSYQLEDRGLLDRVSFYSGGPTLQLVTR